MCYSFLELGFNWTWPLKISSTLNGSSVLFSFLQLQCACRHLSMNTQSIHIQNVELLDTSRRYWDIIECFSSYGVGAALTSRSNAKFNSLPKAATQRGVPVSSIVAIFQAYCGFYVFQDGNMFASILTNDNLHLVQNIVIFISTDSFIFFLCHIKCLWCFLENFAEFCIGVNYNICTNPKLHNDILHESFSNWLKFQLIK